MIASGEPIEALQAWIKDTPSTLDRNPFDSKYYSQRRGPAHVAALNNRADVIEWLHDEHNIDMQVKDSSGESIANLAQISGSTTAKKRVMDIISHKIIANACFRFIRLRQLRKLLTRRRKAATVIQSQIRRYLVYRRYGKYLKSTLGTWGEFESAWGKLLSYLRYTDPSSTTGDHKVTAQDIDTVRATMSWMELKMK